MTKTCMNLKRTSVVLGLALSLMAPQAAFAETAQVNAVLTQQTNKVNGTVVDEIGEPLIGVTVQVKGGQVGAITDFDGNFTIETKRGATLVFSYVGYLTQEIKAADGMKVQLKPDAVGLEDVVVIGYGSQKRSDLTGAISTVKAEDIKQTPSLNAMEGLQGKVAGLDITRSSGQAGSTPQVLLRGNRSLLADCGPLYVIDGVQGGDISNINPNDIESMEVLKDASSTAIYGSAGANGVIIITTRQAKEGKTQVDFNAYVGINAFPSYPKTLSGNAWLDFLNEGYAARYDNQYLDIYSSDPATRNEQLHLLFNEAGLNDNAIAAYEAGKWVNWRDEILQTGVQQNYSVSLRGGTDKTKSYMSASYQQEKGLYRNDSQDMITFRAGSDYKLSNLFKVGFQSTLTYKNRNSRNSRLSKSLNSYPLGDVYNEDGSLKARPIDGMDSYINIMADDQPNAYESNRKNYNINVAPYMEFTPFKGFVFKSLFSTSLSTSRSGTWDGLDTYMKLSGSQENKRSASYGTSHYYGYTWQNVATYGFQLAKVHDITVTGIMEYSKGITEENSAYNDLFIFDNQKWYNLSAGLNPDVNSGYRETSKLSYAVRGSYNLLGRYLLNASIRWDGASQLYHKWNTFPAASIGWRISDEKFMEATKSWLDNLKLRVGYGVTGNANISPYVSLSSVEDSPNKLNLGTGEVKSYILSRHVASYALTWETSYNWNVGLDFAVLNGRLDGSIEWYFTDTKGVLYDRQLPTAFGGNNAKSPYLKSSNVARIQNQGIEFTLNSRNVKTKNFTWNTTFTFATNKEQLKEINLGHNTLVDELVSLNLFLGEPCNPYYGYKKIGIWQLGEEEQAACFGDEPGRIRLDVKGLVWDPNYEYDVVKTDEDGNIKETIHHKGAYYKPSEDEADGSHNYYTASNPYGISTTDKQILGTKNPDWTIGLQNNFTWKGFDLSIMASMRWGQMLSGELLGYTAKENQPACYDYWTPTNPTNAFPRPNFGGSTSTPQKESLAYVEGSYFKIKNITLGYNLPNKMLKKLSLSKLRLYGTITNPIIISKSSMLKGMDPENNASDKFPLYKTMVFGVNVSF